METERTICEHCGQPEENEWEHRSCRLKAAFPGAYSESGSLVAFDMARVREQFGLGVPYKTKRGLRFERTFYAGIDEVRIYMPVQVGNELSNWSWRMSAEEWDAVVEAMKTRPEDAKKDAPPEAI